MMNTDHFERLPREFFGRPSTTVAPELLGCVLWRDSPAGLVAVRLVEVEAYQGAADPASHAYRGQTPRNGVMFGPPGYAYVYFTYGMHFCVNLVCQPPGQAEAVLIRAGEVVEGTDLARERRGGKDRDLARGPGRLCQALAIDRTLDGADVCGPDSPLGIARPPVVGRAPAAPGGGEISTGPRVGISQATDRPWRYWLAGDNYVSSFRPMKPRAARAKPVSGPGSKDGTMHR
jgi:DNA-3-methyladenine glycosylase